MARVTLQDVADRLGLSRSAVSRGLRNEPRIPARTRKRIHEACGQLGYRPDSLLSELAAARWQREKVPAGSVIAYITGVKKPHPYVGLEEVARKQAMILGYQLEVFDPSSFKSSGALQRVLRNRGITDLILGPIADPSLAVELDWSRFIAVQILPGAFSCAPLHGVVRDNFNVVTLAWRQAVSAGYRRIGVTLINHPGKMMDDVIRAGAVHACQLHLFPELPALPPFVSAKELRRNEFVDWIKMHQPDVVLGFNELHFYIFREEFGFDIPYAALHSEGGTLSGIATTSTCAMEGVNLLHYCRRSNQWGIPKERIDHVVEPKWFEGTSLPRKAAGG